MKIQEKYRKNKVCFIYRKTRENNTCNTIRKIKFASKDDWPRIY